MRRIWLRRPGWRACPVHSYSYGSHQALEVKVDPVRRKLRRQPLGRNRRPDASRAPRSRQRVPLASDSKSALIMLQRVASLAVLSMFTASAQAQEADPTEPEPPLTSRAVMTSDQVVQILDETVDWYRMLGVQQQSATQPSDLLILYANRKT